MLGDGLWAMMATWWVSAVAPNAGWRLRGLVALLVCVAVEGSQLIHLPSLEAARHTMVGHLILGTDFDWRDLLSYGGGVAAAGLVDRLVSRRSREGTAT